jgi:hypothetical protein
MRVWAALTLTVAISAAAFDTAAPHASAAPSTGDSRPLDAERSARRERLSKAIRAFDAHLKASSTAADYAGWQAYLGWHLWAAPLIDNGEFETDAMKRISKRLYAANDGFEHPHIVELRKALRAALDFEHAIADAGDSFAGRRAACIAELQRSLTASAPNYGAIEDAAWWLAATGQAPELLARARSRFSAPVIIGQLHRELIETKLDGFQKESHEVRATRNNIQGATVVGTATVNSRSTAELYDAPTDARLRVTARGSVHAPRNTSTSGRVRVTSSSTSQFTVTADLYWNGERFAMTEPHAVADLHSTIRGISAPRLFRRAAARRVYGSRASAEAQGESIVERQAAEAMSAQLAEMVDKVNRRSANFLNFVTRTGNKAQRWTTKVRETAVEIGYLPASSPAGIGALPHEPPPLTGDETLSLSFHDAAIESILSQQVAGAVWRDTNFSQLQRELTGGNTEELMIGLDPQRWSVQWCWRLPVRIHFQQGEAQLRYRFDRVTIDGADYEAPFEVITRLRVSASTSGHELERPVPPEVVALDPQRPLPGYVQEFLERKFRGPLEPFHLDGLQFPAGGELDGLSGYRAVGVILEPGWAHMRYSNRRPQATLVKHATESGDPADAP